jgi:2-keto-4-pentenoate hydratase
MAADRQELAELLLAARRSGKPIQQLAAALVPANAEAAYGVQDMVAPALGAIAGWKVGASGPTAEPNCAPLFAALMAPSPSRWPAGQFRLRGIEGELAFRMGQSLPPRSRPYDEKEVWEAAATLHPAIEIVDSRFADFPDTDKLALLADNGSHGAFCYGPPHADWRAVDFLRQPVRLTLDGQIAANAVGGNAAGHPGRLLVWLANHLARRGRGLMAGDFVTTGTHTGLVFAAAGGTATVNFPGIGEASVAFARQAEMPPAVSN